jgi:tripartite ATP-independent transporter DctP family solute receptor
MLALILVFVLAFQGASSAQTYNLKYGCTVSPDTPLYRSMVFFSSLVSAKTNGKVQVKTYPLEQLGTSPELAQGLANGTVDMAQISPGELATVFPPFEFLDMPFLFNSLNQALQAIQGEVGETIAKNLLKERGINAMAYAYLGVRYVTSNKPLKNVDDLKGFKMRVWPAKVVAEGWKATGANPTPMAFGELYTGLQQGVVEGQSNVLVNTNSKKFYEVQKYLNAFYDNFAITVTCIHDKTFQKLPKEYQKILIDSARDAASYGMGDTMILEDSLMEKLKGHGMTLINVDPDVISKLQQMVYSTVPPKFEDRWGKELFGKVRALAGM